MRFRIAPALLLTFFLSALTINLSAQDERRRRGPRSGSPGKLEGIQLRLRSEAAPGEGIAVLLLLPERPRYTEGAPVVINVVGGHGGNGLVSKRPSLTLLGFIELRFAFPGCGFPFFKSSGVFDGRGIKSVESVRDVILFAVGKLTDSEGRSIQELAGDLPVLTKNVGLVGQSNGGNAAASAIGLFGDQFPELAFLTTFESPLGQGAVFGEMGTHRSGPNPAYNADTGVMDFSSLAWDPRWTSDFRAKRGAPSAAGGLYFDLNGDGRFDRTDFAPEMMPYINGDSPPKFYYSIRMMEAAIEAGVLPDPLPAHVAGLDEVKDFWWTRDGAPHLAQAVKKCPKLLVIAYANERDHVQAAADHPHVLITVQELIKAGAAFVRLNPDRCYVEATSTRRGNYCDNPAGKTYDHMTIRDAVEPKVKGVDFMVAAVCELADRTQAQNLEPDLDTVLFPDAPNLRR